MISITKSHLPSKPGDKKAWGQLHSLGGALAIAQSVKIAGEQSGNTVMVICPDNQSAEKCYQELLFFLTDEKSDGNNEIVLFPDWETLVYDTFSPHQDIISERLHILNRLSESSVGILVVSAPTLMQRLAPRSFILANSLMVEPGQHFDIQQMRRRFEASAYRCVETVLEHGEFAVRGSILDIFPMGSSTPFRIDLFDDEVDSIRVFDPESQLSSTRVDAIKLLPAREFPLDKDSTSGFKDRFSQRFQVDHRNCSFYQDVSQGIAPAGIEYYLPLFFDKTESLFDYLPENTLVFSCEIDDALNKHWTNASSRYENLRHDVQRPIFSPGDILISPDNLYRSLKSFARVEISETPLKKPDYHVNFETNPLPDLAVSERSKEPFVRLKEFLTNSSQRTLIVTESAGRKEILDELLGKNDIHCKQLAGWSEFLRDDVRLAITASPLERGVCFDDQVIITEQDLFSDHVPQGRRRQKTGKDISNELIIKSLTELNIGSPVVHIDHGVGRYLGLKTLSIENQDHEFLCLAYQEEDKLYVPVSSLHLISRYAGTEEDLAPIHRLGGETWQKAKRKAAEKAHDAAVELLSIYARREAKKGISFPPPDEDYYSFTATFPFEETPDQQTAITDVINDMTQEKTMDRLICGDVGFGKTEVAMRAAFLAVQAGRQVAILVPTTLLAQQHTETFKDRFAEWPVSVEMISRFRTKKEQKQTIEKMKSGDVDIVIGTHALIQDGLEFKDLGLLVIDEEHRFGVRQKEKIKSLRSEVDILTMTATPIPRTLNLALSNMRDLSIISTPPAKRLSIKTFVRERQDGLIKEAIQRELLRGGQVYYLHNEVKTIENTAQKLEELVPEARIAIGHGQLRERELEKVMSDFYHKRANLLVCSTIIETGIDVPNANTIIMDRADKLGLAQIHQLRGRVGRSHHQAYAYLLRPHPKAMTSDAAKRLEAIQDAAELGSGFVLASHDLEIRGAGELLGDEQTGHMQTIGYTLYMEMLERAVNAIKEGKTPNLDRPLDETTEVNLRTPALIPESYLSDVHQRLVLYKRISNAEDEVQLRDLQVEMIDRFGLLPDATKALFKITSLRLEAAKLGIKKIDAGPEGGKLEFTQDTPIDPLTIVQLIQKEPLKYKLTSANQLKFTESMEKTEMRFQKIQQLLDHLQVQQKSKMAASN